MPELIRLWDDVTRLFAGASGAMPPAANYRESFPLPNQLDTAFTAVVEAYQHVDENERATFEARVRAGPVVPLLAYAVRMATYAVKAANVNWIVDGLIAVVISAVWGEPYEAIDSLTQLYASALTLRVDPVEVFRQTATLSGSEGGEWVLNFVTKRKPEDRTLGTMLLKEGTHPTNPLIYQSTIREYQERFRNKR